MNWSELFKKNVLGRGYEQYRSRNVSIVSDENKTIRADVIDGVTHKVTITLNTGGISDMTCTCQRAAEGSNCSHMAAALFAYYKNNPPAATGSGDDEINNVVSAAEPDMLRRFLLSVLKENQELFLRFKSLDSAFFSMPQYRAYIDDIIDEYSVNGSVEYHAVPELSKRLSDILVHNIGTMTENGMLREAFTLLTFLTRKIENTDIDDAHGDMELFSHQCVDCANKILNSCGSELKRELFDEIIEKIYASDCTISDEFYEELLISNFHEQEFSQRKLEYIDRNINFYMNRPAGDVRFYRVEYWLCCKLQIMYDTDSTAAQLDSFLRAHYRFRKIRNWFVDYYIKVKRYKDAAAILRDSIKADSCFPGCEKTYKHKLKDVYRLSGQKDEYMRLLWDIVKTPKLWSYSAYKELRSCYPHSIWLDKREAILSRITNNHILSELYAAEKMYPELLDIVLKSNGLYLADKYIDLLLPQYPGEIMSKYTDEVNKLARMANSREMYKQLVTILRHILNFPGGEEQVSEIVSQWRAQYKRRRAMMEELDKIKLGE